MSKLKAKKPEEVKPGHCKGVLFGKSGAGKTWFALNFPAPYFIDTEAGSSLAHYMAKLKSSHGAYMGPEEGSNDFNTIIEQVKALATEKHEYKTLVIDSITKVFQSAIAQEVERMKNEGIADAFGASKKPAVAQMRRLINWIGRLDMNVWFLAHEVSEWGLDKQGQRTEIGKAPDCWDKLVYELDLALRIEHPSANLRFATVTKSRLIGFPEHDKFVLQNAEGDLGYAEFSKRYGKDYIETDAKPIELCSAEQVSEIERLLSVLKVDASEVEKILTKASADTIAELSTEQAKKFETWLLKKVTKGEETK